MTFRPEVLFDLPFEEVVQTYTEQDTIRYALSIGLGHDPVDPLQLPYVYEKGLRAFPTMAAVLACPPPWTARPETGITRSHVVHGEQRLEMHAPLPPVGRVRARERIAGVYDKGEGRGAVVIAQRQLLDADTDRLLATLESMILCRADGGFGGAVPPEPARFDLPDRPPDVRVELPTLPQQALLYRLNADRNPLHVDPALAHVAGFPRPILHGLCTWGMAAQGIVRSVLSGDADRLRWIEMRFSQPVVPGETVTLEIWQTGEVLLFRALVQARGAKVLDRGRAGIHI